MNLKRYIDAAVKREVRRRFADAQLDQIISDLKDNFRIIARSSLRPDDKSDVLFGIKKILALTSGSRLTKNEVKQSSQLRFAALATQKLIDRIKNTKSTTFDDKMSKDKVRGNLMTSVWDLKDLATDIDLKSIDRRKQEAENFIN